MWWDFVGVKWKRESSHRSGVAQAGRRERVGEGQARKWGFSLEGNVRGWVRVVAARPSECTPPRKGGEGGPAVRTAFGQASRALGPGGRRGEGAKGPRAGAAGRGRRPPFQGASRGGALGPGRSWRNAGSDGLHRGRGQRGL